MPGDIFVLKDIERRETVSNIFRIIRILIESEGYVDTYTLSDSLEYKKNSTMFNDALQQIDKKISTKDSKLILSFPLDKSSQINLARRFHGKRDDEKLFCLNKHISYPVFKNLLHLMYKALSNNIVERTETKSDLMKVLKKESYGRLNPQRVLDIYAKSNHDILEIFEYPYFDEMMRKSESNIRNDFEIHFQFTNSNANWEGLFKEMNSSLPVLLFALFGTTPKIEELKKLAKNSMEKKKELTHEVGDQVMRRALEFWDHV